jgi:hypothetical protein
MLMNTLKSFIAWRAEEMERPEAVHSVCNQLPYRWFAVWIVLVACFNVMPAALPDMHSYLSTVLKYDSHVFTS